MEKCSPNTLASKGMRFRFESRWPLLCSMLLQDPAAPPLVILDFVMPGMSGPELCRKLSSMTPQRVLGKSYPTRREVFGSFRADHSAQTVGYDGVLEKKLKFLL